MYDNIRDKKYLEVPWDITTSPSFPWELIKPYWGFKTEQVKEKYFSLVWNEEEFNVHVRKDPTYS